MVPNLYVRIRGRVQGPFDEERLRALARRGQVSRIHEVSEDGARWVKAGDFPDLFAAPQTPVESPAQAGANGAAASNSTAAAAAATTTTSESQSAKSSQAWYYVSQGTQQGPVERAQLEAMFASGQLAPTTHVWTEGMGQWAPARTISGLVPETKPAAEPVRTSASSAAYVREARDATGDTVLSPGVVSALVGSYAWVMFIAIMIYLYAAVGVVAALMSIILGAKANNPILISYGLISLVSAVVYGVGGLMLNIYCNRMSKVQVQRDEASLETALLALKTFWVYIGILLIIGLAFGILVGIMAISAAGAF